MAPRLTVRPAEDRDVPALASIYNEAVLTTTATYDTEPQGNEARKAWLDERRRLAMPVLVAELDGVVVGWGALGPHKSRIGYRYTLEDSVYVTDRARGRGVGTALLTVLLRRAKEMGAHVVLAGIDAQNEASLRLHRRFGFRKVAHFHEVGWKFGRWLDVAYLQLTIEQNVPGAGVRRRAPRAEEARGSRGRAGQEHAA